MAFIAQYRRGLFSVLGSFSKGVFGSASINFGLSGGANCERRCRHHPEHPHAIANPADACYAKIVELRADRAQLADKLARHEELPASLIVGRARHELEREALYDKAPRPWIRFSTNGSVPGKRKAMRDSSYIPKLRALLEWLIGKRDAQGRIHFPVESAEKAEFYREHIGDLIVVRESLQTPKMDSETISSHRVPSGPVSFTAGEWVEPGKDKRLRVLRAAAESARAWAEKTGRKTIVCPAVRVSFLARLKAYRRGKTDAQVKEWVGSAKCGSCRACALPQFDVVYPAHGSALPIVKID